MYVLCTPDEKEQILEINTFLSYFLILREIPGNLPEKKPRGGVIFLTTPIIAFPMSEVIYFGLFLDLLGPRGALLRHRSWQVLQISYFEYTIEFPSGKIVLIFNFLVHFLQKLLTFCWLMHFCQWVV